MQQLLSDSSDLYSAVSAVATAADADLRHYAPVSVRAAGVDLADALYATPADPHTPEEVFPLLRWGGQVVYATRNRAEAEELSKRYSAGGFVLTQPPRHVARHPLGIPLPFLAKKTHYFVARKTQLIAPGQSTERFTYHVYLDKPGTNGSGGDGAAAAKSDSFVVVKEVPTQEAVISRLRRRWPELPDETVEKRARKFTDKIFPIFLTREAAILKIVHRDLPDAYKHRVPHVLGIEKDARGYVRKLHLNWLRNGGTPLGQIEFAKQSADLLRILHDTVGVMHLDLRLDNFVITEQGVGFVDFGSAVRDDEDLKDNPLLNGLFDELMRTSEIQRMLYAMTRSGQVTSQAISSGLHKVDKAVDFFYLAVQISAPHSNPDLKGLIRYDPASDEAKALSKLTARILRPKDPTHPRYQSAADIYHGIQKIEEAFGAQATG